MRVSIVIDIDADSATCEWFVGRIYGLMCDFSSSAAETCVRVINEEVEKLINEEVEE